MTEEAKQINSQKNTTSKSKTLYTLLMDIEDKTEYFGVEKVAELQKDIIHDFVMKNSHIGYSIRGQTTIEGMLQTVSEYRKGIKRFLPSRKKQNINKIVDELGELIEKPHQLRHNGIFAPDNFVTGTIETSIWATGISYITPRILDYIFTGHQLMFQNFQSDMVLGSFLGILFGALVQSQSRGGKLPVEQARYIDQKIKQLYNPPVLSPA